MEKEVRYILLHFHIPLIYLFLHSVTSPYLSIYVQMYTLCIPFTCPPYPPISCHIAQIFRIDRY